MQGGASMEEAMGMLRNGSATSENKAPALGRGLGVGSVTDTPRANGPLSQTAADKAMADRPGMNHSGMDHFGMDHSKMAGMKGGAAEMAMPDGPPNASQAPLFPQDAFMESPMMAMDKDVDKPETNGLPPGWSGYIGGMMTLVRVMTPGNYEEIMSLKAKQLTGKENGAR